MLRLKLGSISILLLIKVLELKLAKCCPSFRDASRVVIGRTGNRHMSLTKVSLLSIHL